MIDKLKEILNLNNENEDEKLNELIEIEQEYKAELDELKAEYSKQKALLPFEEVKLLKAKEKFTKARSNVLYHAVVRRRENFGDSLELDRKYISTIREVESLNDKKLKTFSEGRKIILKCQGYNLAKDPRIKVKAEIKRRSRLEKQNKLLEERINLIDKLDKNRKNILEETHLYNQPSVSERIGTINTKIKKNIKRLQHQNKAKIDRDYESILEEVEKELKEIREEKALMNSL